MYTPSILWVKTCSMGMPLMNIGVVGKGLYLRNSISVSLHLGPFNRMPCSTAKVPISFAIIGSMLNEHL